VLLFDFVNYVFLLLCLCIVIVMLVPFCALFHCVVLCIVFMVILCRKRVDKRGQIRRVRMGGERTCVLVGQIRRCAPAHCGGISPIPGSAIFPDFSANLLHRTLQNNR
jgi:hypothetical protein